MRVFVLEDDPERVRYLRERLLGHELTVIDSCQYDAEFAPPYDLILLDHDLGGRQLEDHEDSGTMFADLIKNRINPEAVVLYHSYNPVGALRMQAILKRGYIAPFRSGAFNRILMTVIEARCRNQKTLENLSSGS